MSDSQLELTEREALLSEAERIAKVGSWIWDVRTSRVRWSDELYRILGYPLGSEATAERFYARLHPEDQERIREQSTRAAQLGETPPASCRIVRPDGSVRHVEMTGASLRDANGALERLVGTVLDVTESRATRDALEHTAEVLRNAQRIAHLGSWRWLFANERAEWSDELFRIHGLEPGQTPTLAEFAELIHPEDRAYAASELERARTSPEARSYEIRVVRPDNTIRHVYSELRPVFDERGQYVGVHGTVHDVTERRNLERQLLQAQKLEALGRLAGGVAHDFNNLLTIIMVSASIAESTKRLDTLKDIVAAADRAKLMTRQLLTFSRQAVSRTRSFDAVSSTLQGLAFIRRLIGEDVTVEFDPPRSPLIVHLDDARFQQILVNLLVNARDAMPAGGSVTVSLESRTFERRSTATQPSLDPGRYVVLLVRDSGVGMDEPTAQHALEPFFTTKEIGTGTGLGLSTVFGIASQAGGAVSIESAPGRGTTVSVFFPQTELATQEESATTTDAPVGGTERILLVEDDPGVARLVAQTLSMAGYCVVTHTRPSEAIAAATSEQPFDLLLTDLMLPEMNGAELALRLGRGGRARKVLFATGHAPATLGAALPDDASILNKPFTPKQLLAAVRAVLDELPLPVG